MERAFGVSDPFTVGLEEELFLVDPGTRLLRPHSEALLDRLRLGERAGHEAYAAQLELRSPPCDRVEAAAASLAAAREAARDAGGTLLGAGLHPAGEFGAVELVDTERYRRVGAEMRGLIRRTPEGALHVHVGMPDERAAVEAHNALRAALPLLQGLAASSAFWFGADSGMASARAALVRAYPGRGVPEPLRDLDEWDERVKAAVQGGGPEDYTLLWWDVRLHPRLGTVELRELDAQSRLADVASLAALARGLARRAAERGAGRAASGDSLSWSAFRAARDGLRAEILHDGRLLPLREAARSAVEAVRPYAREQGDEDALEGIEHVLAGGAGADRQRAAHASGGMEELLRSLVKETAGG
ncbi:MAG: YbdK family carboxylate-amine ligase [Thermoleophilaceae bacterium]